MMRFRFGALAALALAAALSGRGALAAEPSSSSATPHPQIVLTPCHIRDVSEEVRCGTYEVFENRQLRRGRKLPIRIVLLPATGPHPQKEPIFILPGGPGETAVEQAPNSVGATARR